MRLPTWLLPGQRAVFAERFRRSEHFAGAVPAVFGSVDRYFAHLGLLLDAAIAEEHVEVALGTDRRIGTVTHPGRDSHGLEPTTSRGAAVFFR